VQEGRVLPVKQGTMTASSEFHDNRISEGTGAERTAMLDGQFAE
jgi:hypothetical protein